MKLFLLILYGLAFFAGYLTVVQRQNSFPAGWVAAHELPANRLLQPGDIVPSGSGRYATRLLPKDAKLQPGDLSDMPDLSIGEGVIALALPLREGLRGTVNAGVKVRICKSNKPVLADTTVKAVVCTASDGTCTAIITLAAAPKPDELQDLFDKTNSIEPMKRNPPCP